MSQLPSFACSQEFILTTQRGIDDELLSLSSLICINHEEQFRLKHASYLKGGTFATKHKPKLKKRNALLNPTPCAFCQETSTHLRNIASYKNEGFIKFIIEDAVQRMTRSGGTGISQDDDLCRKCYQILRFKWKNPNYSPVKYSQRPSTKRKSKRMTFPPSKQTCIEPNSSFQSMRALQIDVQGFQQPCSSLESPSQSRTKPSTTNVSLHSPFSSHRHHHH